MTDKSGEPKSRYKIDPNRGAMLEAALSRKDTPEKRHNKALRTAKSLVDAMPEGAKKDGYNSRSFKVRMQDAELIKDPMEQYLEIRAILQDMNEWKIANGMQEQQDTEAVEEDAQV